MVDTVRPDKAAQILEKDKRESPDNRVLDRIWLRYFIIFGIMTAGSIALLIYDIIAERDSLRQMAFCVAAFLVFDGIGFYKYYRARILGPRRYLSEIERFGKANVLAQLMDESTRAFFFEEDDYRNIMILTSDYLISANDFIFALDEIESITFRECVRSDREISQFTEEYTRQLLRNIYSAKITHKKGTFRKEYIAVKRSDFGLFLKELKYKAPKAKITFDRF